MNSSTTSASTQENKQPAENVGLFSCANSTKQERIVRFIAGFMVLLSVSLAYFTANMNWLWLTLFVGANLFQSSMTRWCLLNNILAKFGVRG
jgi:hypothetical protein